MAEAYNNEVVRPAQILSQTTQIVVPTPWTRALVARHFQQCKLMPRRKIVSIIKQAEKILDLTYSSVRQRNPTTGEVRCDPNTTKMWWQQAKMYTDLITKVRPFLETKEEGAAVLKKKIGTPSGVPQSLLNNIL